MARVYLIPGGYVQDKKRSNKVYLIPGYGYVREGIVPQRLIDPKKRILQHLLTR